MRKKYHVAVGENGGIITDDYDRALLCKKYLRGHIYIKKYFDYDEAEEYLLDHLVEKAPFGCPLPLRCELNKMLTIRKLMNE